MLKSLIKFSLLFALQFCALAQTVIPIPTRPTFPLQRPTQAGEVCSIMPLSTNTPPREYLTNVVACAAAYRSLITLKPDGTVRVWVENSPDWSNVPTSVTNVVDAQAGGLGIFALREDGSFVTWNAAGAISNSPPDFKIVAFAVGYRHILALRPDGTVAAWGTGYNKLNPEQVTVPQTWTNIVALAAGGICSAGLTADGEVHAVSELGTSITDFSELGIDGLTGIAKLSIAEGSGLALRTDGTVVFAGTSYDPLSFQAYFKKPYPVSDIVAVASDRFAAYALSANGIVEAWGRDEMGQAEPTSRGIRNIIAMAPHGSLFIRKPAPPLNLSIPQRPTHAGNLVSWPTTTAFSPAITNIVQADRGTYLRADGTVISSNAPSGLGGVVKVGSNWALREDGTVVSWGTNISGQSLVAPIGLTNVVDVAASFTFLAALLRDGSIVIWPNDRNTIIPLNPEPLEAISAGADDLSALTADQRAVTWGVYYVDELMFPSVVPNGLTNVVALTAEGNETVALKSDGTVQWWGFLDREHGLVPINGVSNVVQISGTTILKADGDVLDWDPRPLGIFTARRPVAGLTNVISIGPKCAIVDGLADTPTGYDSIQTTATSTTLHIYTTPGLKYQLREKYNATNTSLTNVFVYVEFQATNQTTVIQFTNLPPGVAFDIKATTAIATASVSNGQVVAVSLPPYSAVRYTTAPNVVISGCGPSVTATATAILNNGLLSNVSVTRAGSGYNNCIPNVQIDPPIGSVPPFSISPDLITLSRAAAPGHLYQFESSTNLVKWVALTSPALAQTNRLTLEIPVTTGNTFYRLTEFR